MPELFKLLCDRVVEPEREDSNWVLTSITVHHSLVWQQDEPSSTGHACPLCTSYNYIHVPIHHQRQYCHTNTIYVHTSITKGNAWLPQKAYGRSPENHTAHFTHMHIHMDINPITYSKHTCTYTIIQFGIAVTYTRVYCNQAWFLCNWLHTTPEERLSGVPDRIPYPCPHSKAADQLQTEVEEEGGRGGG